MPAIRWTKSDGGENWASYNGYVGDRLRFHICGERFGGKVSGWGATVYGPAQGQVRHISDRETMRDVKRIAQKVIDKENS